MDQKILQKERHLPLCTKKPGPVHSENFWPAIESFHKFIRQFATTTDGHTPIEKKQDVGKYLLANIANCDQTSLQLEFLSGTNLRK